MGRAKVVFFQVGAALCLLSEWSMTRVASMSMCSQYPGNGGGAGLPGRRSGCCPGHTHPRSPMILAPAARCVTFVDAQTVQHRA